MTVDAADIAASIAAARRSIAAAAERSGRSPEDVTLLLAAKGRTVGELMEAYRAGVRDFGENRADELAAHASALPGDVRWHFIGTVQRRKVPAIRERIVLLHSLDRPRLADAWAAGDPVPPVLVEVNVGREPQKHGVLPEEAAGLVEHAVGLGIEVRGLMTVPPLVVDPEAARPYFHQLAALATSLRVRHPAIVQLSMGMSDDYGVAVEAGATVVRLGRAIFGSRPGSAAAGGQAGAGGAAAP